MKTVKEVSLLTGVSVRALHHYDAIGLLKPTRVTEAGYRLYDDTALARLQSILLFRQLQFSLKDIKSILDSPTFQPMEALEQQIHHPALLQLYKAHFAGPWSDLYRGRQHDRKHRQSRRRGNRPIRPRRH